MMANVLWFTQNILICIILNTHIYICICCFILIWIKCTPVFVWSNTRFLMLAIETKKDVVAPSNYKGREIIP